MCRSWWLWGRCDGFNVSELCFGSWIMDFYMSERLFGILCMRFVVSECMVRRVIWCFLVVWWGGVARHVTTQMCGDVWLITELVILICLNLSMSRLSNYLLSFKWVCKQQNQCTLILLSSQFVYCIIQIDIINDILVLVIIICIIQSPNLDCWNYNFISLI